MSMLIKDSVHCYDCGALLTNPNAIPKCPTNRCEFKSWNTKSDIWQRSTPNENCENATEKKWQLPTPTPSDCERSISNGISDLEQVYCTMHAQHCRVVGICSDLLVSFQPNIGTEITAKHSAICASFAKLLVDLEDLRSYVGTVKRDSQPSVNKTK